MPRMAAYLVGTRRPAPGRRAALTRLAWPSAWSPSHADPATMLMRRSGTTPAASWPTWSALATPGARHPAAVGPRLAVTWTIRSPGIRAGSPANATWPHGAND